MNPSTKRAGKIMTPAKGQKQLLYENLIDAKCGEKLAATCMALAAEGKEAQMTVLLRRQRKELLDEIHDSQKALDALDYLMFQIENRA